MCLAQLSLKLLDLPGKVVLYARGRGMIVEVVVSSRDDGDRPVSLCDRHRIRLGRVALLEPVEYPQSIPADHAFVAQDFLQHPRDVANAVRRAREVGVERY